MIWRIFFPRAIYTYTPESVYNQRTQIQFNCTEANNPPKSDLMLLLFLFLLLGAALACSFINEVQSNFFKLLLRLSCQSNQSSASITDKVTTTAKFSKGISLHNRVWLERSWYDYDLQECVSVLFWDSITHEMHVWDHTM